MIFESFAPCLPLRDYVEAYHLRHFIFPQGSVLPFKPYQAQPEQTLSFYIRDPGTIEYVSANKKIIRGRSEFNGQHVGIGERRPCPERNCRREWKIVRRQRPTFANGMVRYNVILAAGHHFDRQAQWHCTNGIKARAKFDSEGRILQYWTAEGIEAARIKTQILLNPLGYTGRTTGERIDGTVIGSQTVHPGSSSTLIFPGSGMNDQHKPAIVTERPDGAIEVSQVTIDKWETVTTAQSFKNADGSLTGSGAISGTGRDGQSKVTAISFHMGSSGKVTQTSMSDTSTLSDGGFSSICSVDNKDGTGQKSSFVADGKGNSSQTVVTYLSDGGFSIITNSVDSDGKPA